MRAPKTDNGTVPPEATSRFQALHRHPMKPIIIFDLDGTLIDSRADLALAVNLTRRDYGLPDLPLADVVSFLGDGIENLMKRAFADAQCPWSLDDVVASDRRYYASHLLDSTAPFPHVLETLPALKEHFNLAVVTNKPQDAARAILDRLGILPFLDSLVGGGRTEYLKPHPEPIRLAVSETDSLLDGSWMVGDHRTDLGAAIHANIKGCFCKYGFGRQDGVHADASINAFNQLIPLLIP